MVRRAGLHREARVRVPLSEVVEPGVVVAGLAKEAAERAQGRPCLPNEAGESSSTLYCQLPDDKVAGAHVLGHEYAAALIGACDLERLAQYPLYLRWDSYRQHFFAPNTERSSPNAATVA